MKIIKIFLILIFTYVVIRLFTNHIKPQLLFDPVKINNNYKINLNDHQQKLNHKFGNINGILKEFNITSDDGIVINGLHYHNPSTPNCILYSHGNYGHIYRKLDYFYKFGHLGSFVMYDYRGYGKTTGDPTINGVLDDSLSVWKYLTNIYTPEQITIFGESMGGSISAWLTMYLIKQNITPAGLVMLSGFASLKDICKDLHGYILSHLVDNDLDSKNYIKEIQDKLPILIIHSPTDELIPYDHAYILLQHNPHAKQHVISGSHSEPDLDDVLLQEFNKYLYKN